jgi:hypothetical protein
LRQVAPGRYEGDFEAAEIGTYLVNVSYDPPARDGAGDDERAPPVTETTGISLSYSPEYADMGANLELIRQLAGVTPHGRVLTGDAEVDNVFRHDLPPNVVLLPAWQRLMWWALVLFLFDIVLRRVLVSWADVWRRLQLAAAKVLPPVGRYLRPAVSLPGGADVTVAQHRATMEGVSNKRRDELLASLDAEDVEGERRRPSADTGGESAAAPPKPPATNYTSRLLNAKKKATGGKSGSDDAS